MPELKPSTLYRDSAAHTYLDQDVSDPHQQSVVHAVLHEAGVGEGDCVLEIGAGSGRYTKLLLSLGLRVVATEPDDTLRTKLAASVGDTCEVTSKAVGDSPIPDHVVAIVGFHILHHLDGPTIDALEQQLATAEQRPDWRGAAFLEPNPLNPLYLAQILCRPGIRLREERRLWFPRFHRRGSGRLRVPCHVGLLPPTITRRAGWTPSRPFRVSGRWCPWSAYRVIARRKPEA
ncbi:MAG: hypothetical protein QF471_02060 [Phycisphaerales bacterium]|jgi:hypothetical protein|nr:hypothetical protein [Phycisphaerales bacterium]